VSVIDEDLGRSASGTVDRPGFRSLVGQICEGTVGGVFSLEASRLSRNGRDWHHLLELCGLVGAYVIDADGVYDPASPNDRLLLGLKGTMSEFELSLIRGRLIDAQRSKAKRGDLRIGVPVGYVWSRDTGLMIDPDRRVQQSVRTIFRLFERFGSGHQVLMYMRGKGLTFPRPSDGKSLDKMNFAKPVYRNVINVLTNPFYAGAYAYGKSRVQTKIVDGKARKIYGRRQPRSEWTAFIRDHHEGYISWVRFEQIQERLTRNSYGSKAGAAKTARGGMALLSGLLRCRRCGRMLQVTYGGRGIPRPRYSCRSGVEMHGTGPCITFGGCRPDTAIGREILVAVQPLAVEAALVAAQQVDQELDDQRRAIELERQQLAYQVQLAARRYEAVDPDNRLVAAELEARWNAALSKLRECQGRIEARATEVPVPIDKSILLSLAEDLQAVWHAPTTEMRTKQQVVRALVEEVVVDVDDAKREVVMVIHWRGGQHSELRVRKPETGEHSRRASEDADKMIRAMAARWSDGDIAATLNRTGSMTGQGLTWTSRRVAAHRRTHGIAGYESAVKDGRCLTMLEAAQALGVSCHVIRRLIRDGVLPARQLVFDAPWQILAADLHRPDVQEALSHRRTRSGRPLRISRDTRTLEIPGT
jgi:DNA invertase Pin-like site-specific DNA recombinase